MAEEFQNIRGFSALQRELDDLPARIEANLVRGGLRAGAKIMLDEAQRLAPSWTGRLKRGIRLSVRIRNGRIVARVTAGGRSKETMIINVGGRPKMVYVQPFWAKFVEDGTAAHRIMPKNKKALMLAGTGQAGPARPGESVNPLFAGVDHPGTKPKPFMRPAFDTKWRSSLEAMGDYVRGRLPRALRKYR